MGTDIRTAGDDAAIKTRRSQAIIERLFLFMQLSKTHGQRHPLTKQAVDSLKETIAATQTPLTLQFLGQAVFRDRILVPFEVTGFEQSQILSRAVVNLSVHEISINRVPEAEELHSFGNALVKGAAGPCEDLLEMQLPSIKWRELPGIKWGMDSEKVDPEVFVATQVALAIADAEVLTTQVDEPWDWGRGLAIIRRLERSINSGVVVTSRALEIAPGQWTIGRRMVAAAFRVLSALTAVKASLSVQRAATQATLVITCFGLKIRGGNPIEKSAPAALNSLLSAPISSKSGVTPHGMRACSLVHRISSESADAGEGITSLLKLCYDLEQRRCPKGVAFDLTFADLLAYAVADKTKELDSRWVKILVKVSGNVPAGANVRLKDGRLGIVLGPSNSGDPLCPSVLVNNKVMIPPEPVELISSSVLFR